MPWSRGSLLDPGKFVPVAPATGGLHPKVKAAVVVSIVAQVVVAALQVAGVHVPGGLEGQLEALGAQALAIVAAFQKAAR